LAKAAVAPGVTSLVTDSRQWNAGGNGVVTSSSQNALPLPGDFVMHVRAIILSLAVVILVPCAAGAQERGQFGVAMGYPASVGFMWHVSDRVAIRPEVSFSHSSTESETSILGITSSSDTWTVSAGGSALWYFGGTDRVRPYFSPRVVFGHSSNDHSSSPYDPVTGNTISASGSFGAQYSPVRKFAVYGEVGYGFSRVHSELQTPISTSETTGWGWGTRSAADVILYFARD
jgi:hypothetical protein